MATPAARELRFSNLYLRRSMRKAQEIPSIGAITTYQYVIAALIFLAGSVFLLGLRSHAYTAVDGPMRCLEVFRRQTLFFHGNNHLLYPAWILIWTRAARYLGFAISDPFNFMRVSQAMMAVLAAASLGLTYLILVKFVKYTYIRIMALLIFASGSAFLMHATNAAEVMPGFFFSLFAIQLLLELLERSAAVPLVLVGLLFALAMASYESMILAAPIGAALCFAWRNPHPGARAARVAVSRLAWISLGGVAGLLGIYGFAYAREGIRAAGMAHEFFSLGGSPETYGGIAASKLLNIPVGAAASLLPVLPPVYSGLRHLLASPDRFLWLSILFLSIGLLGSIGWLLVQPFARMFKTADRRSKALSVAYLLGCAPLFFPLIFWAPLYDKFWLQPLILLVVLGAVAYDRSPAGPKQKNFLKAGLAVLLCAEVALNLPGAIRSAKVEPPYLNEASEVGNIIGQQDFAVVDFDEISTLYLGFFRARTEFILLPASRSSQALDILRTAVEARRHSKGKIYFLGVLDQSRANWTAFLGNRIGIPYESFDTYRHEARIVKSFDYKNGRVTLREFSVR